MRWQVNHNQWVDLYALLEIRREAKRREIEDAIIARGADLLVFSFARGSSELVRALQHYSPDFRPILLHTPSRRAYDEQLLWHESGDSRARPYDDWKAEILALSSTTRLTQSLQHAGQSWKERVIRNLRDSEYI